jgi:ribosomal protein L24E
MGRWEKPHLAWHETTMLNCALCGKIIPGKIWVTEVEGETRYFCTPDCERLYHEYWLPKYGTARRNGQDGTRND